MIFGAILAGGVGSRMNISDMPKQFLKKNKLITMPWSYIFKKEFLLENRLRFLEGIYN